ncbi:MAG: hypothetical protein Q8L85_08840 [Alphaproteobacteria bacterium]|nr:hypothetical protein [Alphaproteobacteria bacterium]
MKLNISAMLMLFIATSSSLSAYDSDDEEESIIISENEDNEEPKNNNAKRPYHSENESTNKKQKIDSITNIEELLECLPAENETTWSILYYSFIKDCIRIPKEEIDKIFEASKKFITQHSEKKYEIKNDWTKENYIYLIYALKKLIQTKTHPFDTIIDITQQLAQTDWEPAHYESVITCLSILPQNNHNTLIKFLKNNFNIKCSPSEGYANFLKKIQCIHPNKVNALIELITFVDEKGLDILHDVWTIINIVDLLNPQKCNDIINSIISFFKDTHPKLDMHLNDLKWLFLFMDPHTYKININNVKELPLITEHTAKALFLALPYLPESHRTAFLNHFIQNIPNPSYPTGTLFDSKGYDIQDDKVNDDTYALQLHPVLARRFINYFKSLDDKNKLSLIIYWKEVIENHKETSIHIIQRFFDTQFNDEERNIIEFIFWIIIKTTKSENIKLKIFNILLENTKSKEKNYKNIKENLLNLSKKELTKQQINEILDLLLLGYHTDVDCQSTLENLFKKRFLEEQSTNEEESEKLLCFKLNAYILFGDTFREAYNQLISSDEFVDILYYHIDEIVEKYSEHNSHVQELLSLYNKINNTESDERLDSISDYLNLLSKLKENYKHNPIGISLKLNQDQERLLDFTINEKALSYLPLNEQALATLEDVDATLGKNPTEDLKDIRNSDDFKKYFKAPFSEESMMIQAMVKKFKTMEKEDGLKKLAYLMHDMDQCVKGKNQAIWDHYLIESKPLFMSDLKTITTWLIRLQETKNPYINDHDVQSSYQQSRKQLSTLISNMLTQEHIFRRHFTDIKTDNAQRLKALLGSIANLEQHYNPNNPDDRIILGNTLKKALHILITLSKPQEFYQNLDHLCKAHKIYLPANKFGDQLSADMIEALIQKLTKKDVEGRDDLLKLQDKIHQFFNNNNFINLLNNFNNENGQKLRALLNGYIENGWVIGLLNLIELAETSTLDNAIHETFKHTRIDKDVDLTWLNLKQILMKELITIKRQCINAIAENLSGKSYAECPHDIAYIEGLIGGIIGLHDTTKSPDFDLNSSEINSNVTSQSLQKILDLFYEQFTPDTIIDHLESIIKENKLSIIHPETGINIIWTIINNAVKEQLHLKNINQNNFDLEMLLLDDQQKKNAIKLSLALLLEQLDIFKETNKENNIIINNNMITD